MVVELLIKVNKKTLKDRRAADNKGFCASWADGITMNNCATI